MIDPASAIVMATSAFSALRKGIQMGRDVESMAKDLSRWGKACADFDFAEQQLVKKPPWYKQLGGGVEAQALEIYAQRRQLEKQREELKMWVCGVLGPSQWDAILEIEAQLRKTQREHEHRRHERWRLIQEWVAGIALFLVLVGALVGFVWLANG